MSRVNNLTLPGQAVAGHGIGRLLMLRLLEAARRRGITALTGNVRTDNTRMLELCRDLGAAILPIAEDPGILCARFELGTGPRC